MKKSIKIAAIATAAVLGATAIGLGVGFGVKGCSSGNGGNGSSNVLPDPTKIVTESEEHKITDGLHKINITATDVDFIKNGATDYVIVMSSNADERTTTAASDIARRLKDATGATFATQNSDELTWSADKKWIVVNDARLFAQAGLSVADDIGETGYAIKTSGSTVFLHANSSFGTRNAALKFLNFTVGYEMYADDTIVYDAGDSVKLLNFDVAERPDFNFYVPSNKITAAGRAGMGFMDLGEVFISVGGNMWHNSFNYINPDDHASDPTKDVWFADNGKEQLCYTAHSSESERGEDSAYAQMVDAAVEVLVAAADANPDLSTITLSIEDMGKFCTCEACTAEKEKYGTDSAAVIKFINAVADKTDEYYKEQAKQSGTAKRELNILFFAYRDTVAPPVKLVDGKYVPIDESVVCRDNVGVYIAPIGALYSKSFYHEENSSSAENIRGWGVLSNKLYMWLYETNYHHYLYPLNSFASMIESLRFCKENNAIFMYIEGQWNQDNVTGFAKLKEYFDSKAQWNVNLDFSQICDDFFRNYFGAAAEPMRKFFDELQAHMVRLEKDYPEISGSIYDEIGLSKYWPKRLLDGWNEYIDQAYAAIEASKGENPDMYETYKKHILLESMFPRFALLTQYSSYYVSDELRTLRTKFREDCNTLGITMVREHGSLLDEVFSYWD